VGNATLFINIMRACSLTRTDQLMRSFTHVYTLTYTHSLTLIHTHSLTQVRRQEQLEEFIKLGDHVEVSVCAGCLVCV
jgi:hypothetical protein